MAITKYHIGCTGWSLNDWVGEFFTDDAKPDDYLRQYATVFNSVEGNTTLYNIPQPDVIEKWGAQTPDGFKFCFKFHRSITHHKQLDDTADDIARFLERFEPIYNRLGPFMIQLPPSFSPDSIERLEKTLSILPSHFRYAVEVRHPDFFDHGRRENTLMRLLESYNVDRITFDTRKLHSMQSNDPSIREAQRKKPTLPVRFKATGSHPIVRFVGANDPLSNEAYLKEWAIIIADWIKEGLHPYMFTHAPHKANQPLIARKFHNILSGLISIKPMPSWPVEGQDEQLDLF